MNSDGGGQLRLSNSPGTDSSPTFSPYGYLQRQPDALYLNWIAHLEATADYRSMINGF